MKRWSMCAVAFAFALALGLAGQAVAGGGYVESNGRRVQVRSDADASGGSPSSSSVGDASGLLSEAVAAAALGGLASAQGQAQPRAGQEAAAKSGLGLGPQDGARLLAMAEALASQLPPDQAGQASRLIELARTSIQSKSSADLLAALGAARTLVGDQGQASDLTKAMQSLQAYIDGKDAAGARKAMAQVEQLARSGEIGEVLRQFQAGN